MALAHLDLQINLIDTYPNYNYLLALKLIN